MEALGAVCENKDSEQESKTRGRGQRGALWEGSRPRTQKALHTFVYNGHLRCAAYSRYSACL